MIFEKIPKSVQNEVFELIENQEDVVIKRLKKKHARIVIKLKPKYDFKKKSRLKVN